MVEGLEDRRLLALTLQSIPLASATTQINGVAAYPDGNIWFTATGPAELGVYHPATNVLLELPLAITNSAPDAIAVGKDGNLDFTDPGTNSIGVFDPATLKSFEVPIPTAGADPNSIAVANDGTVWFTENRVGKVGEYDPATQKITEYPLATTTGDPNFIQLGPDGDLWFKENRSFDSIDPTTKAITTIGFPPSTVDPLVETAGFSFTPEGIIHFLATFPNFQNGGTYASATLDPATQAFTFSSSQGGSITFFNMAPVAQQHVTGSDGNVYYSYQGSVGEIDVATGTISTYSAVPAPPNGFPPVDASDNSIAAAAGAVYFGETGALGQGTIVPMGFEAISGTVTVATRGNAPGGAPIAGRTVYVDLAGTGTFAPGDPSAITDADGNYTIPDVPLGNYTANVVPDPGDVTFVKPIYVTSLGGLIPNVNVSVQPSTAILPLNFATNEFGPGNASLAQSEVVGLYNIILDRAPDASGEKAYTNYLQNGGSLAVVAETLLHSAEYETDLVTADYRNFLGRAGSSAEVSGWVAAMQSGFSAEQVAYGFMTSAEFNSLHPDNASFIQALYGDVLGRSASAAEVSSWEAYLAGSSRAAMVNFVTHSPEAGIRAAQGFYAEFWATPPVATGETAVVNALASGLTLADVASLFAAAPQFVFVASLYAPLP